MGVSRLPDGAAYEEQLVALLPPGRVWPVEAGSNLRVLLRMFGEGLVRVHNRVFDMIMESDVRTTNEMLTDWERVLELPDPDCVAALGEQTFAERRNAVVEKFVRLGGASAQYFIDLALSLGFVISIREYGPDNTTTDLPSGITHGTTLWKYTWEVNAPLQSPRNFLVNVGRIQEPLRSWNNEILECFLLKFKPAHTNLIFVYA